VMIGVVLIVMTGNTVRTLQGVGWMPITSIDVQLPYWAGVWFGIYPTVETIVSQFAAAAFVIGSYFLAERMRKPGRKGTPTPAPAVSAAASSNGANGSNQEEPAPELETQRN